MNSFVFGLKGLSALSVVMLVTFPLAGNSNDRDHNEKLGKKFSEYLVHSGEYFCVSELYAVCFGGTKLKCAGEVEEYKSRCLDSVDSMLVVEDSAFDPDSAVNKYLSCIVDYQLNSLQEKERIFYKNCLGPRFKE